jgi:DNA-binding NarL/FixJ family response regulator
MGKAGRERCARGGPRTATAFRPATSVGSQPFFASLFKVLRKMSRMLTAREREVMLLAAEGLSDKEIARRLKISDNTVSVHLQHIYRKFKICNRTMLGALAASS